VPGRDGMATYLRLCGSLVRGPFGTDSDSDPDPDFILSLSADPWSFLFFSDFRWGAPRNHALA